MGISSDKLSLFTVATGPRGSGKSLLLTGIAGDRLLRSFYSKQLKGTVKHVWTNLPVGFKHKSEIDGKVHLLKSEPLNMEAMYTFDKGLESGWVFIDEIDQWYDRQDWQSVTQKLLNSVITQIRKRKLSLFATIQNFQWLNARAQFQTDILVGCREAAFSPWGRKMGMGLGEAGFLQWKDISGVMIGYQYEETKRYYATTFFGKRFWDCYDTEYQFDPTETKMRYSMKQTRKVIELGADGYKVQQLEEGGYQSEKKDGNFTILAHVVQSFIDKGVSEVETGRLWKEAYALGFTGDIGHGGALLPQLGVVKHNRVYQLCESQEETPPPPIKKAEKKQLVKAGKK